MATKSFPSLTGPSKSITVGNMKKSVGKCGARIEVNHHSGWGNYLVAVTHETCARRHGHTGLHASYKKEFQWARGITHTHREEHDGS
jgi:hypothetical protein